MEARVLDQRITALENISSQHAGTLDQKTSFLTTLGAECGAEEMLIESFPRNIGSRDRRCRFFFSGFTQVSASVIQHRHTLCIRPSTSKTAFSIHDDFLYDAENLHRVELINCKISWGLSALDWLHSLKVSLKATRKFKFCKLYNECLH